MNEYKWTIGDPLRVTAKVTATVTAMGRTPAKRLTGGTAVCIIIIITLLSTVVTIKELCPVLGYGPSA